jgi:chitinase
MAEFIKQIKAKNASGKEIAYDIDAKKWDGHSFSEITNLVHGVVDTYVIPAQTSNKTSDYKAIVESSAAQVTTTTAKLGALTGTPSASWDKFGVGDIVLMGATSDGNINFDRWISSVDASGNVKLDILETQVATHHHTFPTYTTTSAKVLTDVTIATKTTNNVAYAGSDVTVLQGEKGDYVTSVTHDNSGKHNLTIATATSTTGVGHTHTVTVSNHNHTVKFKPTSIVSESINAYTDLQTGDYTPHKHSAAVTAAGAATNSASFKYVNGGSTDTFIKSVTDASTTTNTGNNTAGLSTGNNTAGLSTSTQASTDTIGDVVKTKSAGDHTHSVSATTTEEAIKTVSLAANVTTSVKLDYTAPSVQGTVVTAVTYTSTNVLSSVALTGTTSFVNTATVDNSGILSFGTASVNVSYSTKSVASTVTPTTGTQSSGSASLTTTSTTQSYTSGTLTATCTTDSAGAHQHGFSHTHTIPAHTHSISAHTHTYYKTVASETGSAYKSLTSANHTPHTHETSVTAAGATSNDNKITYVKSGTSTAVVKSLLSTEHSCTVGSKQPGATVSTTYMSLSGEITFPGLTVGKKSLTTTTFKPAVDSGEKPAMTLTLTSVSVVKSIADATGKTSTNIGGSPA